MEGLQSEQIAARLQTIRVPVLMLRAPAGFVPGAPPLFPEVMIEQMRKLAPAMDDELIAGTTHYTLVMGKTGAARVADLANDFAARCESSPVIR
jgi:hypothetical protein